MNEYHRSVLLHEAIAGLNIKPGKRYIDATLGGGGHTRKIINQGGIVLGLDVDEDALCFVSKEFRTEIKEQKLVLAKGNFRNINILSQEHSFEHVDGILFDLGVSSYQFDTGDRGFSFRADARLDMRMDNSLSVTAADLVNGLTKGELYELFTKLGEEHFARAISNNIINARMHKLIETTGELARIAERSYPSGMKKLHPGTKIFQALRIAVNDELHSLEEALPKAINMLERNGRLVVISFHSLEDRIVKNYFKKIETEKGKILTEKPIIPTENEVGINTRARSAKLRIFETL